MRVAFFDNGGLVSAALANTKSRKKAIESTLKAQATAQKEQQNNTCNCADDDTRNSSTTQSSFVLSCLGSNQIGAICSHWRGECFGGGGC
jgi:hypothetical protein